MRNFLKETLSASNGRLSFIRVAGLIVLLVNSIIKIALLPIVYILATDGDSSNMIAIVGIYTTILGADMGAIGLKEKQKKVE